MTNRFDSELFMAKIRRYSITNGSVITDSSFNKILVETMEQCNYRDFSSAIDVAQRVLVSSGYSPREKRLGGFEIPLSELRYR